MTQKRRIALTVDGELDEVLTALAKMTKTPKTAVITEILTESLPAMRMVLDSLDAIKHEKKLAAIDVMGKFLSDASSLVNQAHIDFGEVKGIIKEKLHDK